MKPVYGTRGMAVAPHALAAQSGLGVLRDGGNALEAMVAMAATIAIVYPHMNGLGGDAFWLIHLPGQPPRGIDACGASGCSVTRGWYAAQDIISRIPFRGGVAANTVAGTVAGWQLALDASKAIGGRMPLARLLDDAIHYAEQGTTVTVSQADATRSKRAELESLPGFVETFVPGGTAPLRGARFVQPRLAATLRWLAREGLADFYHGDLARSIAKDLEALGSPLTLADLDAHQAEWRQPLTLAHSLGRVYNFPPPTQGAVSLAILGQLDRLGVAHVDPLGADFVHVAVEATKRAFREIRDRYITDPRFVPVDVQTLLEPASLDALAGSIDRSRAAPWVSGQPPADTVWMGAIDGAGRAVSFIQSVYHEFGAAVVLAESGICWQNRGCSFSLDSHGLNALAPGRKPFHTLNPAMASLDDGRTIVYGAMGGDGQPQTQSAVFTRIAMHGMDPAAAIEAPRWLLGRTWGQATDSLKLESRFAPDVVDELRRRGHDVDIVLAYDEIMGHAGCVIRHADGRLEGGSDPRSDGGVAAY